jgi:hypothetical protein
VIRPCRLASGAVSPSLQPPEFPTGFSATPSAGGAPATPTPKDSPLRRSAAAAGPEPVVFRPPPSSPRGCACIALSPGPPFRLRPPRHSGQSLHSSACPTSTDLSALHPRGVPRPARPPSAPKGARGRGKSQARLRARPPQASVRPYAEPSSCPCISMITLHSQTPHRSLEAR